MVYLASPFHGDYSQNIKNAIKYCKTGCDHGVMCLAPHIIFSQWCSDTIPEQREQGLKLGLSLLSKSEELWVMGRQISEGMQGEIAFAKEHSIPIFYVEHPHDPASYPVSADGRTLLSKQDCVAGSRRENYTGQTIILQYENLKPEYRTPLDQIWMVTHGPGCRPDYVHSDTIHLLHLVDGDRMVAGRGEVYGIAKPEVLKKLAEIYSALSTEPQIAQEQDEGMCL